uniref:Uncharacterized protein n=1 Tax=Anguilla anguilla TaxID=7936 RepID=A0A0E9XJD1_ANGAN
MANQPKSFTEVRVPKRPRKNKAFGNKLAKKKSWPIHNCHDLTAGRCLVALSEIHQPELLSLSP